MDKGRAAQSNDLSKFTKTRTGMRGFRDLLKSAK
jgi:hypothetical protein